MVPLLNNIATGLLPLNWYRIALLAAVGAMVTATFATAVFVFVGPIRLVSLAFDYLGWSGEFERTTVTITVLVMSILLLAITLSISWVIIRTELKHVRFGLVAILLAFGGLTTILWMYPNVMVDGLNAEIVRKDNFAFGSFPSEDRLEDLNNQGYSVVTLMHPAILPYEKRLLEIERESAEEVGIKLIEIPMLPWMGQNTQAIEELRELSTDRESKYYVHCWFGMHRTVHAANVIFDSERGDRDAIEFPEGHSDRAALFALPTLALVVQLGGPVLLITAILALGTSWLKTVRKLTTSDTRKVFHIAIFTVAAGFQITLGLPAVIVFGVTVASAVAYAVYRGEGFPLYDALARSKESEDRKMLVLVPLISTGLGGVVANVLFFGWAHIGYLACGWGDAAGETIGKRIGRHPYSVSLPFGLKADRSIEGSVAVFVVASLAVMIGLLSVGVPIDRALWVAPIVGLVSSAVEAVSGGATDNLSIQIAAAGTAYFLAG